MPTIKKKISVVTPCYNEEESIEACYNEVNKLFENQLADYELEYIFSDNCSSDNTVAILEKIADQDKRIKVIVNANNFGVFRSMYNALISTSGDAVIPFLPADMQDPPELIIDFVKEWQKGNMVVYGQRVNRQEPFLKRSARNIYYKFINRYSKVNHPLNAGEFQLLDRQVVNALKLFDDYQPYVRGMIASCGFKSTGIPYTWRRREKGMSKAGLAAMIDQGFNGIVSSTNAPIRIGMIVGLFLSLLSIGFAFYNVFLYFLSPVEIANKGIMTLITGLFFLSGVQLFFTALVGEYVASINSQVRKGPTVIELKRINF